MVADGGGGGVVGDASEFIAGELFCEEAVPRHVCAVGADDVVAVVPCVWSGGVVVVAVGVGVAGGVEPVAAPAFCVVRGGEELVDEGGQGAVEVFRGGRGTGG